MTVTIAVAVEISVRKTMTAVMVCVKMCRRMHKTAAFAEKFALAENFVPPEIVSVRPDKRLAAQFAVRLAKNVVAAAAKIR